MSDSRVVIAWALAVWLVPFVESIAAVVGTNAAAEPLTLERIEKLPVAGQKEWVHYLGASEQQRRTEQNFLQQEMRAIGLKQSIIPPSSSDISSMPLHRPAEWYGSKEARRIAGIIVSFQTPSGGWSKNIDVSRHERRLGEGFAPNNSSPLVGPAGKDELKEMRWSYVGTIDNGATVGELRFLAKVISVVPEAEGAGYRAAFSNGVSYLLAAQYPNGGWPQVWPLQGGYHDAITYNDDAMVNVLQLLRDIADGRSDFQFAPQVLRGQTSNSLQRGIDCVLASQIVVAGRRTVWCQQHDPLTLKPTAARHYEMPSLCSAESAGIVGFLIQLPEPDTNVVAAVRAAVAWLEKTQIKDVAFGNLADQGRLLVPDPGGGPLWSRYYEIESNRPIFGERDKTIHDTVEDISVERRQGYAWYTDSPNQVIHRFKAWSAAR